MDIVIASESVNLQAHGIDVFRGSPNAGTVVQTITFGALGNQPLGAPPVVLSAVTASSGLRVVFASNTTFPRLYGLRDYRHGCRRRHLLDSGESGREH